MRGRFRRWGCRTVGGFGLLRPGQRKARNDGGGM